MTEVKRQRERNAKDGTHMKLEVLLVAVPLHFLAAPPTMLE